MAEEINDYSETAFAEPSLSSTKAVYMVDIDYEAKLFQPDYHEKSTAKIIKEWEYVYFLIQQNPCSVLKNVQEYDSAYLERLRSMGFCVGDIDSSASTFKCFWGHHHDTGIERRLNSKLTSADIASRYGWGFVKGAIIRSFQEVQCHVSQHPEVEQWLLKKPHFFSGIGQKYFYTDRYDEGLLAQFTGGDPVLLEPYHTRVCDIGTTFVLERGCLQRVFMVENTISEAGSFLGGIACSTQTEFKEYIKRKYKYDLEKLEQITRNICDIYIEMGAVSNVQIDSFVYRDKVSGCLELYPLVEVNYRKTMGLVVQSLADKFPDSKITEWRILATKTLTDRASENISQTNFPGNSLPVLEDIDSGNLNPFSGWVRLSPDCNSFHSFLRCCRG